MGPFLSMSLPQPAPGSFFLGLNPDIGIEYYKTSVYLCILVSVAYYFPTLGLLCFHLQIKELDKFNFSRNSFLLQDPVICLRHFLQRI